MKNEDAPKTVALDRPNAATRTIFFTVARRDKYCPIRGILRMSLVYFISPLSIRRRLCHRKICCPRPRGICEDNLSSDVAGLWDTSYELFTNSFGNSSRTSFLFSLEFHHFHPRTEKHRTVTRERKSSHRPLTELRGKNKFGFRGASSALPRRFLGAFDFTIVDSSTLKVRCALSQGFILGCFSRGTFQRNNNHVRFSLR